MSLSSGEGEIHVRSMALTDLPVVVRLAEELGYAIGDDALRRQWERLEGDAEHALFVGCDGDVVVGWIHVHARHLLESESFAEIGGLVVSGRARRRGIGRRLVMRARGWAAASGFKTLRVRSNVRRVESHAFYPALGFEPAKTQHTYIARLENEELPPTS